MSGGGMMMGRPQQSARNQEATIYIGNLDEKVTEPLLKELMVQVGPVVHVHIPRDRVTQQHQGYGFIEFQSEEDAEYAVKIMSGIRLYGKPLRINKSSMDRKSMDVGANLFIGSLAPEVDEKMLFDTFILFGTLIQTPKVARDENTGLSRGYGFVSYDGFEASDGAIEAMNGQFLCNRPITVNYAFKRDGKGERHGSAAERLVAAQSKKAALATAGVGAGAPMGGQYNMMMMPGTASIVNPLLPTATMSAPTPGMMYPSNVPSAHYYSSAYPPNQYVQQAYPNQPYPQQQYPYAQYAQQQPFYSPQLATSSQLPTQQYGYYSPQPPSHLQQHQQAPPQ